MLFYVDVISTTFKVVVVMLSIYENGAMQSNFHGREFNLTDISPPPRLHPFGNSLQVK